MSVKTITLRLSLGVAAGVVMLAGSPAFAVDNAGAVSGVVKGANGQPVAGAFVRLKNPDARLTFMVVSQQGGAYMAKDLPAGNYTVQAIGGSMQSDVSAPVAVPANGAAKMDVALNVNRGPMLTPAWPGRVPETEVAKVPKEASALPDGEGKQLVAEKCTVCHDVQRIMSKRSNEADWAFTVRRMRTNMAAASLPDLSDAEADAIVKYTVAHFQAKGGTDPNSRLPQTLATGKGAHYRVVAIDLPKRYSEPHDIAAGPNGIAWVAQRAGRIVRFDPNSLSVDEIKIPAGPAPENRQRLGNPQVNAQGVLWTADGPNQRWLSYNTLDRAEGFHSYPWTEKGHGAAGGNTFALHPDGTVWGTGMGREARMLNPQTAEWKFFPSPSASKDPGAYGMAIAGDGSVWWAEDNIDMMARVDPKIGKVEEFPLPPHEGHALPRRMNSDWNGDLWVGLWNIGKLMKIDHKTKEMTMYTPSTPSLGMYSVVADKKNHYIWVSAQEVDKIFRFDPATGEFVEFPLAYSQSDPRRIDIDVTNPNRIFYSGNTADRFGFVEYLPEKD